MGLIVWQESTDAESKPEKPCILSKSLEAYRGWHKVTGWGDVPMNNTTLDSDRSINISSPRYNGEWRYRYLSS